jgi:imidazolonepropionase-like amidohydrolase
VSLNPPHSVDRSADSSAAARSKVEAFTAVVELPRDRPSGSLLLSGATAITMDAATESAGHAAGVIEDADILIEDDHIRAIGRRGELDVPRGTVVRNVSGK